MAPPPVARTKIEAAGGFGWIIEQLEQGRSIRSIASEIGVGHMTVYDYCHIDSVQSARTDQALKAGAEAYEQEAVRILQATYDKLDTDIPHPHAAALASLAKERAQAAWRQASTRDRSKYSDSRAAISIDASTRTNSITIVGMPTRGGVQGIAATRGSHEVGVLPSDAVEVESDDFPARADAESGDKLVITNIPRRVVESE